MHSYLNTLRNSCKGILQQNNCFENNVESERNDVLLFTCTGCIPHHSKITTIISREDDK